MIGTFLIGNWFWIEFHKLSNNQCYFIMFGRTRKTLIMEILSKALSHNDFFNFMFQDILLYPFKVLITLFQKHPHKKYLLIPTLNFLFIKGIIKFFFSFATISSFIKKNIIGMFSMQCCYWYCYCCFSIFFYDTKTAKSSCSFNNRTPVSRVKNHELSLFFLSLMSLFSVFIHLLYEHLL